MTIISTINTGIGEMTTSIVSEPTDDLETAINVVSDLITHHKEEAARLRRTDSNKSANHSHKAAKLRGALVILRQRKAEEVSA